MKKVLLALTLIGLVYADASAQTKKKSNYAKNYKICLTGNKYQVCDRNLVAVQNEGRSVSGNKVDGSLSMLNEYVHMGYSARSGQGAARNSRIRVTYDDPTAPYEGKESMVNDGVQQNKSRNINYLDTSVDLPANDGQ